MTDDYESGYQNGRFDGYDEGYDAGMEEVLAELEQREKDAAELRAAIREWCAAVEAERSAWDSACAAYTDKTLWDKHQEAKRLVIAAEVRLHTLAATEEGE